MKLLIALIPAVALAGDITLNDTPCTSGAVCFKPAPTVDWVSWTWDLGRLLVSVNGDVYDSGVYTLPVQPLTQVNATIYDAEGNPLAVSLSFKHYTTTSGRLHVQHWELLGGTLQ